MDVAVFMLRYIPFWAVPLAIISGEFGYIYWLKSIYRIATLFWMLFGFSIIMIGYYYYAGSPENASKLFVNFLYFN